MSLHLEEIQPGTVAILEVAALFDTPLMKTNGNDSGFRGGPFLCVQVKGDQSTWLHLTSRRDSRGLRLEIRPEWRLEGSAVWRDTPQFVSDARKPFVGPSDAFVSAGANELTHQPHSRPRVSPECVAAVVNEMTRYNVTTL